MFQKSNRILAVFLFAILAALMLPAGQFALAANAKTAPEAPEIVDSGICGDKGDNLKWTLDDEGTLTISGTGAMKDYPDSGDNRSPFAARDIITVVIRDGITGIGDNAFLACSKLQRIYIPESVEKTYEMHVYEDSLGEGMDCAVEEEVGGFGYHMLQGCRSLAHIYYAGSADQWRYEASEAQMGYDEASVDVHFYYKYEDANEAEYFSLGDVNTDGKITAQDARLALRAAARLEALSELQNLLADADEDGKLKAGDARLILRIAAKLDPAPERYIADQ